MNSNGTLELRNSLGKEWETQAGRRGRRRWKSLSMTVWSQGIQVDGRGSGYFREIIGN
jgi:hypothetical protein